MFCGMWGISHQTGDSLTSLNSWETTLLWKPQHKCSGLLLRWSFLGQGSDVVLFSYYLETSWWKIKAGKKKKSLYCFHFKLSVLNTHALRGFLPVFLIVDSICWHSRCCPWCWTIVVQYSCCPWFWIQTHPINESQPGPCVSSRFRVQHFMLLNL